MSVQGNGSSPAPHGEPGFGADVAAAWRVWRREPVLPLVTAALWLPTFLPDPLSILALPAGLFLLGWNGTQRIWYLRAFRDRTLSSAEAWSFTWKFFGRHLVVGLVVALPIMAVAMIPPAVSAGEAGFRQGEIPASVMIAGAVATFVLDVLLTFVMPALAFSTREVTKALGIGVRMLRSGWPGHLAYVLVPPLALATLSQLSTASWTIIAGLVSMMVGLLMKGAIAAYYLRRHHVGDDGAANAPRHPWEAVPPPPPPPPSF